MFALAPMNSGDQHVGAGGVYVHPAAEIHVGAGRHVVDNFAEIVRTHAHVFAVAGQNQKSPRKAAHSHWCVSQSRQHRSVLTPAFCSSGPDFALSRRVHVRQRRAVRMKIRFARINRHIFKQAGIQLAVAVQILLALVEHAVAVDVFARRADPPSRHKPAAVRPRSRTARISARNPATCNPAKPCRSCRASP